MATRPLALRRTLGRAAALGLTRTDAELIQVHRLTQAIIARSADGAHAECADRLLAAAAQRDVRDPAEWPRRADLLPHLLVRVPVTASLQLRQMAARALHYLELRGEYRTAQPLAHAWHRQWQQELGPDDHAVLAVAEQLAGIHQLRLAVAESRRRTAE